MKKYIPRILMILFAAVFLVSAGILANYFINSQKQKNQYNDLAELVQQAQQQTPNLGESVDPTTPPKPVYTEVIHPDTGEKLQILTEYAKIFKMNTDTVGWIRINGTKVNYPVMQAPRQESYYLKRDFYKKDSRFGCIYAEEDADLSLPSDNITLYGHNMNDGSMFASLHKYNSKEFYEENPYITFDTLYEHRIYQIIAVFNTTDLWETGFAYHLFVDGNKIEFAEFVAECKSLSLYDTGVSATYGDQLLTLSTCDNDYEDDHGRFAVVAKRIA